MTHVAFQIGWIDEPRGRRLTAGGLFFGLLFLGLLIIWLLFFRSGREQRTLLATTWQDHA
tara:strand:- start:4464 stop:4643 length:180 start_codon:yes stop_codon:yes gene_type:complete